MICDVDPDEHPEAQKMSSFIPTTVRREIEPSSRDEKVNIKEKEKRDYVFCLRQARVKSRGGHVLMVEDDTLPKPEMLRVLSILMSRTQLSNVAFIKVWNFTPSFHLLAPSGAEGVTMSVCLSISSFRGTVETYLSC